MVYKCRHFKLVELVGPEIHATLGERAWQQLDEELLRTIDAFRDKFGPATINNWAAGGTFKESGLRDPGTATGAKYSQHKRGHAADMKFRDTTPQAVYAYALAHPTEFPHLTCLENVAATPTWLHVDTRFTGQDAILVVNP